jgi:hypothetical protein
MGELGFTETSLWSNLKADEEFQRRIRRKESINSLDRRKPGEKGSREVDAADLLGCDFCW